MTICATKVDYETSRLSEVPFGQLSCPLKNQQGNCLPGVLQKIQPYPGPDLNPGCWGLEHRALITRLQRLGNGQDSRPKGWLTTDSVLIVSNAPTTSSETSRAFPRSCMSCLPELGAVPIFFNLWLRRPLLAANDVQLNEKCAVSCCG